MTAVSVTLESPTVRKHLTAILIITAVCGLVDAVCFLALGGVFAELMTGNLLLIAFSIGTGQPPGDLGHYLIAMGAFAVGAIWGGRLLRSRHPFTLRRGSSDQALHGFAIQWLLMLVAVVLAVTLSPSGDDQASRLVVGVLAAAMGMQNATLRVHGLPDVATNVMTLTMTGVIADSRLAGGDNRNWRRRLGSVGTFFVAAIVGAALLRFPVWVPLALALGLLTLALGLLGVHRHLATSSAG